MQLPRKCLNCNYKLKKFKRVGLKYRSHFFYLFCYRCKLHYEFYCPYGSKINYYEFSYLKFFERNTRIDILNSGRVFLQNQKEMSFDPLRLEDAIKIMQKIKNNIEFY